MAVHEELTLLIKSNYPVMYFETIDETQAIAQLNVMAPRIGLDYFQWCFTHGGAFDRECSLNRRIFGQRA